MCTTLNQTSPLRKNNQSRPIAIFRTFYPHLPMYLPVCGAYSPIAQSVSCQAYHSTIHFDVVLLIYNQHQKLIRFCLNCCAYHMIKMQNSRNHTNQRASHKPSTINLSHAADICLISAQTIIYEWTGHKCTQQILPID